MQLWQASGQMQQRLSCERGLYFPELSGSAPVAKQLPDESAVDVQQGKRVKLAGGQHRRASFRDAAGDSTPPGTPHRRSRTSGEERFSIVFTSSSSSQDFSQLQQRKELLVSTSESDTVWPLVVPSKRRRGSRLRRTDWDRWQMVVLHGVDVETVSPVNRSSGHDIALGAEGAAQPLLQQQQQQQQQLLAHNEQQLQQLLHSQQQHSAAEEQQTGEQQIQAQQQQVHVGQHCCVETAVLPMQPPAPKSANPDSSVSIQVAAGKLVLGDVSPGHETSQSSEMTCMQESPSAAAAPLNSWPSSSTDSDCQGQPHVLDAVQKPGVLAGGAAGCVSALLAADNQLPGQSDSPRSPSSPYHGVV